MQRFTQAQVEQWRRDGGVLIPNFFTPEEVAAVVADFERVFADAAAAAPLVKLRPDGVGNFHPAQFKNIEAVPLDCSPALNLIGVHPALIAFARAALGTEDLHLYQCQAWAKFTGLADYDQPFHCDFINHTLTAPSEDTLQNSVTVICYFTDVSEAHGPTHYVPRPVSEAYAGPEAGTFAAADAQSALHKALASHACSTAAPAGSIFPYSIDIYHRGTNLTAPNGRRFALVVCFKGAGDDAIGYHAWPYHHTRPWANIFDHATPDQLACFGVPRPGHRFWTETTLARAQTRYPGWDMTAYRSALASRQAAE
jgi:hypothetical protein